MVFSNTRKKQHNPTNMANTKKKTLMVVFFYPKLGVVRHWERNLNILCNFAQISTCASYHTIDHFLVGSCSGTCYNINNAFDIITFIKINRCNKLLMELSTLANIFIIWNISCKQQEDIKILPPISSSFQIKVQMTLSPTSTPKTKPHHTQNSQP
jgi:hypothetical protein